MVYAHMPIGVIYNKRVSGIEPPNSAAVGYHKAYLAK